MAPHILVIDDRISLPRFLAMELNVEGYQVSIHSEGLAHSSIRALSPDLIILNWDLRIKVGFDVYRQLRLFVTQVPIIIITAKDADDCPKALMMGANTCLTKPFTISNLLTNIECQLKEAKMADKVPVRR